MTIAIILFSIIAIVLIIFYGLDRLRGVSRNYFSMFSTMFTLAVIAYFLTESMQQEGWALNGQSMTLFVVAIGLLVIDYNFQHKKKA
ncbi:hypothetical protein [Alkalibacillus salilacus]|uniref:Purine-cytosine permease-like protein n=1 Tax=Alkalibacillus salilacus TaxID=284582 RepID=A0ABT9VB90_9BACI|nr:hypothetical protein [Alkalibacillus salilacus]MDQ0158179.1 purine-cytosine permease-like protein [Alkalibacillus salilacus]